MLTIGVSLEVPEPFGSYLQSARRELGDPLASAIPAHITLLPPTVIEPDARGEMEAHLARIAADHPPFEVQLRGTGSFRPTSPVVFVTLAAGVVQCTQLQDAVRGGPVPRPLDFPYHPHVTIAHHLSDEALDRAQERLTDFAATFTVAAIHLYHHGADQVWRPVRAFALGGIPD